MLTIARAAPGDIDALAAAHHRSFAVDIERYGVGPAGYGDPDWHRKIAEKLHYFAMREAAQIVGGIIVEDEGAGRYFLNTLFIDTTAQGRGLGAQALAYLDETFPDAQRWHLITPQGSTNAHRLYERAGYLRVGDVTETDPKTGRTLALYRYERERARL